MAPVLYCSFCGKAQYEVDILIAGPTCFICDECIELCAIIVNESRQTSLSKFRQFFKRKDESNG